MQNKDSGGQAAGRSGPAQAVRARSITGPQIVFTALCVLVFLAGVTTPFSTMWNAAVLSFYEIAFVLMYVILSRLSPSDVQPAKADVIITIALAAWFVSVTISLISSPLGVARTIPGVMRYEQTISHVIFFMAVREFFCRYRPPTHWVWIAVAASCFASALGLGYRLARLDSYDAEASLAWFNNPPFNTHIRHTGYQVTAAVAALLVFFVAGGRVWVGRLPPLLILVTLSTLLIWAGGRGAIFSVLGAFLLLAVTLRAKGVGSRDLWIAFIIAGVAGLLVSEWIAVFKWNGVIDLASRTAGAETLNQLSTGRLAFWKTSWESVKDHLPFGLGPQGYWYMPNRIFGVQPHSFLVQFLVEWGLVGSLLFLALLAYAFFRGFYLNIVQPRGYLNIASLAAGTVIVALTAHGLVDGTYYHTQPSLYLALGFAIWTLPPRPEDASVVTKPEPGAAG